MNIKIKDGTAEDVLSLAALIPGIAEDINCTSIARKFYDNDFVILIANLNGKNAGFILGYGKGVSFNLWLLGVLPAARGNKLGKMMLKRMGSRAKDKGYKSVRFDTSSYTEPEKAEAFILSEGFVKINDGRYEKVL